ncbi:hypothetical protein Zmor_015237 [Zophobas morio]|uniref:Reverse transcriptase domain-containing protein n=1 Tax=Zophobas morio TaxID=2755281 RepID=A0AA38MHM2_9CUCU|nr:hypothetical protein Zmor_015237 [Zophobas morio]
MVMEYVKATLTTSSTVFNVGHEESSSVSINRGVCPGVPLSPMLFNVVVDELFGDISSNYKGCPMGMGASCSIVAFVDDIVLLAENEVDLQRSIDKASKFFSRRGISLNPSKCYALIKKRIGWLTLTLSGT